ncbi:MAG: hypothetical protein QOC86_702 [Gaiellales bacterium]|nr:hypothetical protein [Gaiellales bacterium]
MTDLGVSRSRRLGMALLWPTGVAFTAWDYLWRTTPIHRRELAAPPSATQPPELGPAVARSQLQAPGAGEGPLFSRSYRIRIRDSKLSPEELMARIQADPNAVAPTGFVRFLKAAGRSGEMRIGDEFLIRMPGPWDGPVRVAEVTPYSFRLVTLAGHLEAGQIEFRVSDGALLEFEIVSWARSGSASVHVLYDRLRVAKEIQLHMWISFLERVAALAEGRRTGPLEVETRRSDPTPAHGRSSPAIRRRLAELRARDFNFVPPREDPRTAGSGWRVDDLCEVLGSEPPGPPLPHGTFAAAQRLMRGYEFADPSIVRAHYDADEPLEGRTMLLEVMFHGLRFRVGVRIREVYDRLEQHEGRPVQIWGWSYGTLTGHFELGQMDWQVWKWLDSGEIQFRIHAYSRRAPVSNPIIRLGFRIFGRREQLAFLHSTMRRMAELSALAAGDRSDADELRAASAELTAHRGETAPADERLAERAADCGG